MTFKFKSPKQEDIIGNLEVTKICYAISSSNFIPETYQAVKILHIKYGSVALWLIFRLETSVALKSDENVIPKRA